MLTAAHRDGQRRVDHAEVRVAPEGALDDEPALALERAEPVPAVGVVIRGHRPASGWGTWWTGKSSSGLSMMPNLRQVLPRVMSRSRRRTGPRTFRPVATTLTPAMAAAWSVNVRSSRRSCSRRRMPWPQHSGCVRPGSEPARRRAGLPGCGKPPPWCWPEFASPYDARAGLVVARVASAHHQRAGRCGAVGASRQPGGVAVCVDGRRVRAGRVARPVVTEAHARAAVSSFAVRAPFVSRPVLTGRDPVRRLRYGLTISPIGARCGVGPSCRRRRPGQETECRSRA